MNPSKIQVTRDLEQGIRHMPRWGWYAIAGGTAITFIYLSAKKHQPQSIQASTVVPGDANLANGINPQLLVPYPYGNYPVGYDTSGSGAGTGGNGYVPTPPNPLPTPAVDPGKQQYYNQIDPTSNPTVSGPIGIPQPPGSDTPKASPAIAPPTPATAPYPTPLNTSPTAYRPDPYYQDPVSGAIDTNYQLNPVTLNKVPYSDVNTYVYNAAGSVVDTTGNAVSSSAPSKHKGGGGTGSGAPLVEYLPGHFGRLGPPIMITGLGDGN